MSFTITPKKLEALKASFKKISTQESKNTSASWTEDLETFSLMLFAKIEELGAKKVQREKKPKSEDSDRLKRPVPASWMWRDENREKIVEDHFSGEKVKGSEVAKKAVELWNAMSEEEQEPWVTKRQELWDAYKAENPSRTSSSPKSPFNVDKSWEGLGLPNGWNGPHEGKFLRGFAAGRAVGVGKFETFADAVEAATGLEKCGGITYDEKRGYTLRVACDPEQIMEGEIDQISWAKENHTVKREKKTRGKKAKKTEEVEVVDKTPEDLEEELFGSETDNEEVEDGRVTPEIARCMDEEGGGEAESSVEVESEDEEELEVEPWEFEGTTYLLDEKSGDVYDYDSQDLLGKKGEGKFKEKTLKKKVVKVGGGK
jgi:hypothetical protein